MKSLERQLRSLRDGGRKALVPYVMAGLTPDWIQHVNAAIAAGADAVEIGVPFSDPMMDGVVIQEAGLRALAEAPHWTRSVPTSRVLARRFLSWR